MTNITSLHMQLPPAGQAPEWVHLVPAGTFSGGDGRGPYHLENADDVISASMAAGKLPLDENHAVDYAAPKGLPSPARGWIVAMESRVDGLWGRVEWTREGKALLDDHAYRGISPVFMSAKEGGRVLRVLRASLVNDPNLTLTTLHQRSTDMDFIGKLRAALGLPASADEAAVLASVSVHAAFAAAAVKASGLPAEAKGEQIAAHFQDRAKRDDKIEALKAALKADGLDFDVSSPEQITAHLQARGGDAETLRKTVVSLQTQVDTMQAAGAKEKAEAFVDAAIAAGRPIRPLRDHYISQHQKDATRVETEINAMVSINAGGIARIPQTDKTALDADELATCAMMGVDPKAFAESKAAMDKVAG